MSDESSKRKSPAKGQKADLVLNRGDRFRVNEAVFFINDKLNTAIHQACLEIGRYLLEHFFGGDVTEFRAHNPHKHASMRLLKERCEAKDIPLSMSTLHNYIRLHIQQNELGHNRSYQQLGHTQKIMLLPLKQSQTKVKLAARAVANSWSVRALRREVDRARRREIGETDRGRPPKNPILHAVDQLERAFKERRIYKADYDAFEPKQLEKVYQRVERARQQLTNISNNLAKRRRPTRRRRRKTGS